MICNFHRRGMVVAVSFVLTGLATAATRNVPGDHATIQACIDAAVGGDECVVAPGTYHELINYGGKAITLRSSDGPEVTIIDATPVADPGTGKSVVRCENGEGPDTVLEGFTITGGGSLLPHTSFTTGGGMYNKSSSPTVRGCTFNGNLADFGGAMYNFENSNPTVTHCTFSQNSAVLEGGGIRNWFSAPTVSHCLFTGNSAAAGGGMSNQFSNPAVTDCVFVGNSSTTAGGMYNRSSSPTVTNCVFSNNTTSFAAGMLNFDQSEPKVTNCTFSKNTALAHGGGMLNMKSSSPTVTRCTFSGNTAGLGGGMYNSTFGSLTVTNCMFMRNSARGKLGSGGGMYNQLDVRPTVTNCTFVGNAADHCGGAIYNKRGNSPDVTGCTFVANIAGVAGGVMYSILDEVFGGLSTPLFINCVLWGNAPDTIVDAVGALTTVSYSNVQGTWPGDGNIDVDPMFVRTPDAGGDGWGDDPGTPFVDEGANDDLGDVRLLSGSLCIDAGDPLAIPLDVADLDGDGDVGEPTPLDLDSHARVLCGRVDLGAYESGIGDYTCDGAVDSFDFGALPVCMGGPDAGPLDVGCVAFDFNGDCDVDLDDYAPFSSLFTGP